MTQIPTEPIPPGAALKIRKGPNAIQRANRTIANGLLRFLNAPLFGQQDDPALDVPVWSLMVPVIGQVILLICLAVWPCMLIKRIGRFLTSPSTKAFLFGPEDE